jgi:hypothetical protein
MVATVFLSHLRRLTELALDADMDILRTDRPPY